ncbi:glycosyltransferase family 4 protein [Oenococcus sicerae]|uniref:Glycosyltransferase n=1 Tax=Oenococcus sicerae TaxID=2203724 RepID=A0AAJ1VPB4_9LACO|nr:glycosyltransferase family 4 protein [Oenococcus sicerae]MDN6900654.1 glycosyltransferase [Oenococcus sicerae]
MKIDFILSNNYNIPVGGYRIVYEYANMLAESGDDVTITFMIYDRVPLRRGYIIRSLLSKIKRTIFFKLGIIYTSKKTVTWFKLNNKIKLNFALPRDSYFPDCDIAVATAWGTAYTLSKLNQNKGKKFYFIQHDERVFAPDGFVRPTWKLALKKIVIASWLKELLQNEVGQSSILVKNFVDLDHFYLTVPLVERNRIVSMLYHKNPSKGSADGIEALKKVHSVFPDMKVKMFGTPEEPDNLPNYFEYTHNAKTKELRNIYNQSSIYVLPSHLEGWGLTATEAMACGAALISTKNGGVNDFGLENETALLSAPNDIDHLAKNIIFLLQNDSERRRIAANGMELVHSLTKNNSFNKFKDVLHEQ